MPRQTVTQRVPVWVILCGCWVWQVLPVTGRVPSAVQPELLLLVFSYVAPRWPLKRNLLVGVLLGLAFLVSMPEPMIGVLLFWVGLAWGLAWSRRQFYVEQLAVYLVTAWMVVMSWHVVTWCLAWQAGHTPRSWTVSFVAGQTVVTLALAWLWARFAPRWVEMQ